MDRCLSFVFKEKKKDHDFFWISVSDGIKPITEKCCKYAI